MRHLKHRNQLGRKKEHRAALMANLSAALFRHGSIQTTLAKAKALRPFAEKIVTLAKEAKTATPERALHLRRLAQSKVRDRDALSTLFNERAAEFADRPGGYTRIYKLGTRLGDAAEMAVIQLIAASDEGYAKRAKKAPAKSSKPTAAAKEAAEVAAVEEVPTEEAAPAAEETTPVAEEHPVDVETEEEKKD